MALKSSPRDTLIVGCGYIGQRVAQRILTEYPDEAVYAITRFPDRAAALAQQHICPLVADWTDRRTLRSLPRCRRVLVAVSYDPSRGISREASQVGGLSNLLDALPNDADLCYLSTTGVYHQSDGRWVDECSPARPLSSGGQTHLRAESLLHRRRAAGQWVILRLAGIYGPGRIPRAADVVAGLPLSGPYAGYLNLIHCEDAAAAVVAAWQHADRERGGQRSRLYLVADDQPVIRRAFYQQIAQLTDSPQPVFLPTAHPALSARSGSNKRIWNRRMRRDLLPRLHFPSYLQGLTDLLG